jgi:hypothetical protein
MLTKTHDRVENDKQTTTQHMYVGANETSVRTGGEGNLTKHKYNLHGVTLN